MIVSFANQKGGVGKTTIAILLANYIASNKKDLLVVDFDFQASFYNLWSEEKDLYDNDNGYEVISKDLDNVNDVLNLTENSEHVFLFDLPGKADDNNLIPIIQATDLFIIPFSYNKISFESTLVFTQVVNQINSNPKLVFVPNIIKTSAKYKTKDQVNEILSEFGEVSPEIKDKITFQRISTYGNNKEVVGSSEDTLKFILKKI